MTNESADAVATGLAAGLLWAGQHLDHQVAREEIVTDQLALVGCGYASILLKIFAIELALKGLYMRETKRKAKRIHPYVDLFNMLTPETRERIEGSYDRRRVAYILRRLPQGEEVKITKSLKTELQAHNRIFLEFRYPYDRKGQGSLDVNVTFLNIFADSVVEIYKELVPPDAVQT